MAIQHFIDEHSLILDTFPFWKCRICNEMIWGSGYGCDLCRCYVHKSCGELPQEMYHPFHPTHCVTLQCSENGSHVCDACGFEAKALTYTYRCADCGFSLHPDCSSTMPNIEYEGHHHPLSLLENMSDESQCQACGFQITGTSFLRCVPCNMNFHVRCDVRRLPPTVAHKHHQHPLTLVNETSTTDDCDLVCCTACKKQIDPKHAFYFCIACDYFAHVHCVVIEVKFDKEKVINHFSHEHSLNLMEILDDSSCYVCGKGIQGTGYGCQTCSIYLHKSCAEFPRKRHHPFHEHTLTLSESCAELTVSRECDACHKTCYGFNYRCNDCDFDLDLDCIPLQSSIKYEGHNTHMLTFFDKLNYAARCSVCNFTPADVSYLRCVICDFNIHLMCSPLPVILNHWSHKEHPLTLHERYIDNNYVLQICDVCENIRKDPGECIYYCAECDFIVEFKCVALEVIHYLERMGKDVQLKTVSREGLTLQHIHSSCTGEELQRMEENRRKLEEYINTMLEGDTSSVEGPIARLIKNLPEKTSPMEFIDLKNEVKYDGDYMMTQELAGVPRKFLDKHNDCTHNCIFTTQSAKTIFLAICCATVQSMRKIMIIDATDLLIYSWWYNFKLVQLAGFQIDFALSHLQKIEHQRRKRNIRTCRETPLYRLNKKIAELSRKIDDLNAEREEIMSEKRKVLSSYPSEKLRSEAKCLDDDLALMMKSAGTELL